MKHESINWMWTPIILVLFSFGALNVVSAQNPPYGMDTGVWVLTEKKPDVETDKDWDNGLYYNNHVSLSGTTVKGGYSWKDGDDPKDCRGTVWSTIAWDELPGILNPGKKYETTITADAGGNQSCSARHPSACAHLEINEATVEPHPCFSYNSSDPKPQPETATVSWAAPWGKIGDNLKIGIVSRGSGAIKSNVYYIYSYRAEAPKIIPNPSEMDPEETAAKPRSKAKLERILQIYSKKIPRGIAGSGSKNNLLSWLPGGDKYDEFKCGGYQSRVLKLLDSLKFSDDPEERGLLDDWDYGPIEAYWGGHQAVVLYPRGADWLEKGIVLDPWIKQSPMAYDARSWTKSFGGEKFHGIGGSSVYEGAPEYPTVGGTYVDPRNKRLSQEEIDFLKNLPEEKKKIYKRMTDDQRGAWVKAKMLELRKGGRAMGYSPLNIYVTGDAGEMSGFPGDVPTRAFPGTSLRRFPLSDGTYWTELEYPLNMSLRLVVEGAGEGEADVFLGFGLDDMSRRSIYKYNMRIGKGQRFEVLTDSRGSSLSSSGQSIHPEEVQEIEQAWLDSRPEIVAPPEYEGEIEKICLWTGTWESNFGQMELQQSANIVHGNYTHDKGKIEGTVSGNKLTGIWSEAPSYKPTSDSGDAELTMSEDCNSFSGNWRYGSQGGWEGTWEGKRSVTI